MYADNRFIWLDAGAAGSNSDAQIWNRCELKDMLEDKHLQVPEDQPLPGSDVPLPYFIVGDNAFALGFSSLCPVEKQEGTSTWMREYSTTGLLEHTILRKMLLAFLSIGGAAWEQT